MLSTMKLSAAGAVRNLVATVAALGTLGAAGALITAYATLAPPAAAHAEAARAQDVVIFRSGQQVQGEILEETPTTIRMRVTVAGITAETTYSKNDILSIMREQGDPATEEEPTDATRAARPAAAAATPGDPSTRKVYFMELTGTFGEEISQTPIRQVLRDARTHAPDFIIVKLDNDWSQIRELGIERNEEEGRYWEISRALDMEPIFREEIPREFTAKTPTVVFWIRNAMGGGAFLPWSCPDIYFHSEGRMGGIGRMSELFGGMGDEEVRQKQYSAMMSRAEGLAIAGGYDPKIVRAMAWTDYVLSVRFEGGRPVYLERYPDGTGEILLTDDGKEERRDSDRELARGEGNDVLTLKADLALKLGVAKGIADTIEDLTFRMGLSRNSQVVRGRSQQIMRQWRDGLEQAKRQLERLARDYSEIQVQGERREERQRARSRQLAVLDEMIAILTRYEEAIDPQSIDIPDIASLRIEQERIRLEMMRDRR